MTRRYSSKRFPVALERERRFAGLTQAELAAKAKLRRGQLSQFETGARRPSLPKFVAIVNALGVKPEDLL